MTGFGAAEGDVARGRLRIEIRTVNHRYYNPQFRLPPQLAGLETQLREHLRRSLERGHISVSARWLESPNGTADVVVDLDRARQVVAALKQLKKKLRLKGEPDVALVARQPEVLSLSVAAEGETAVEWSELQPIVDRAAQEVRVMREREGAALASDLLERLAALEDGAKTVEDRAP